MKISRRDFFGIAAGTAALGSTTSVTHAFEHWQPRPGDLIPGPVFRHGVASGDPLRRRIILWTRITPRNRSPFVKVRVVMATDSHFRNVVYKDTQFTSAYNDYTVKFDAYGLRPGTTYYYRFIALGERSVIGRTKTLPRETDRVRFGVVSCSNFPAGFFGAYALLAQQPDLDAILHLGDYLYEYENETFGDGSAINRLPEPNLETVELNQYRTRHAQYKEDPQLQLAHQNHPWITVWDDHESANDAYTDGAENHQPDAEGKWEVRKTVARKAYFEWLPIRDTNFKRFLNGRIFRRFRFGDLVQLDMLDTRLFGRERQIDPIIDPFTQQLVVEDPNQIPLLLAEVNRAGRQLLGKRQEAWLYRQIERAAQRGTAWQVFGQQIMMGQLQVPLPAPFPAGTFAPLNMDQWDGYADARNRLLAFLENNNPSNNIVLTGDIHSSWFHDITPTPFDPTTYNPLTGEGSRAVEFVTTAISSEFFPDGTPDAVIAGAEAQALAAPHTQYVDLRSRGYLILDIDRYRARGEWYHIDSVLQPDANEVLGQAVEVQSGTNHGILV